MYVPEPEKYFKKDADIRYSAKTPLFIDSVWPDIWVHNDDLPSTDLFNGAQYIGNSYMCRSTIARHGSRCAGDAPRAWPRNKPMPGAVDVSFTDAHVEKVKLDDLWQLIWHVDYVPPAKRPGREWRKGRLLWRRDAAKEKTWRNPPCPRAGQEPP